MKRPLLAGLVVLAAITGCDLLFAPPPPVDGGGRPDRNRDDECNDDDDCDGGEFCDDDGDCQPIVAEGEGDPAEGEGEPPPPPPPLCDGAGCPEILSLTSNRAILDERSSATISAVVTDPDGVADVIGGVLLDPVSGGTYGSFNATGSGTFDITVSWNSLSPARTIEFEGGVSRVVRARFFDQSGNETFDDVTLRLECSDSNVACNDQCGATRCNGTCLSEDQLDTVDNCGGCGIVCDASAVCENDGTGFACSGGTVVGEPYSGSREAGVVCGIAGTCPDACCVSDFSGASTCEATGTCLIAGADCDGPEDCGGGQECCFQSTTAACVDTGTCRANGGSEVCVNSGDCVFGEVCCPAGLVAFFGGDAGNCVVDDGSGGCAAPAPTP